MQGKISPSRSTRRTISVCRAWRRDKRLNSIDYLLQSYALVKALGGRRVIFHSGSCGKQSREATLEKALDTTARAVKACDEAKLRRLHSLPETMGKINQLGTLDEVLALCEVDKRISPASISGICTPAAAASSLPPPPRPPITPPCWTRWRRVWNDDRAVHFHAHFPALPTPKAGKSATRPLRIPSLAHPTRRCWRC